MGIEKLEISRQYRKSKANFSSTLNIADFTVALGEEKRRVKKMEL